MSNVQALGRCGKIANEVKKKAAAGLTVREIFASIQNFQKAPRAMATFYKYYRDDMDAARGEITEKIANKVIKKAIEQDDFKSQELWLTTKGGWSKQQTNNNIELEVSDDEGNSALDTILSRLGLGEKEKENE